MNDAGADGPGTGPATPATSDQPGAGVRTSGAIVDRADAAGSHPGPASITIPAEIRAAIATHARTEAPNEACGLIIGDRPAAAGGRPLRWEPTRNRAASPFRYEIDSEDLLRLTIETDDADEVFWAIVHSHVASPARPSATDIGLAFYPDALYILISLDPALADPDSGEPALRAWRIVDRGVHEVAIVDA